MQADLYCQAHSSQLHCYWCPREPSCWSLGVINPTGYQLALPTTWSIRGCQWLWLSWSIENCSGSGAVPQVFRCLVDKTTGSNLIICPWSCHLCSSSWAQMSCDRCGSDTWNVSCSQPSFLTDYSCLAGTAAEDAGPREPPTFNLYHTATACAGAPESVTGSQPDVRYPVSFEHLLTCTAARLALKVWTCSHTLAWAAAETLALYRHS